MAKASQFTRKITKTIVEEVPGYIELNLTPEEALFLVGVMGRIGGIQSTSLRKYADGVRRALCGAGVDVNKGLNLPLFGVINCHGESLK